MPTRKAATATKAARATRAAATADLLDDHLLRAIANRGGVRNYAANAVLVTEDDRSDALFIILSGRVKAYGSAEDGREVFTAPRSWANTSAK